MIETLSIDSGWLQQVRHCPSPNYDQRPEGVAIDLLVVHGISLPPGEFGGSYIDQLFTNTLDPSGHSYFASISHLKVSAHVLIRRDGELVQYVSFNDRAWHAGQSFFGDRVRCNDFAIGVELEGEDHTPYEPIQYQRLAEVSECLMSHYPMIEHDRIVGHSTISPGRKTDPGEAFDERYFHSLLIPKESHSGD